MALRKKKHYGIPHLQYVYRCFIFFLVTSSSVITLLHPASAADNRASLQSSRFSVNDNVVKPKTVDLRSMETNKKSFWFATPPSASKTVIKDGDPYKSLLGWVFKLTNQSMRTLAAYLIPKEDEQSKQNDTVTKSSNPQENVVKISKGSRRKITVSTTTTTTTEMPVTDDVEYESNNWNGQQSFGLSMDNAPFWDRQMYTKYWIPPRPMFKSQQLLSSKKDDVKPGSTSTLGMESRSTKKEERKTKKLVKQQTKHFNHTSAQQQQPLPSRTLVNWYSAPWTPATRKGNPVSFRLLPVVPPPTTLFGMPPAMFTFPHKESSPSSSKKSKKKATVITTTTSTTPRPTGQSKADMLKEEEEEEENENEEEITLTAAEKKAVFTLLENWSQLALWETLLIRKQALNAWREKYDKFKMSSKDEGEQSPEQFILSDLVSYLQNNNNQNKPNDKSHQKVASGSKLRPVKSFNTNKKLSRIPDNEEMIVEKILENLRKSKRVRRDTRQITRNILISNANMTDLLASPSTLSIKTRADFVFPQARKPSHVALQHQGSLGILPNPVLKSQLQKFMAMRQQVERSRQKHTQFVNGHFQGDRKKQVTNNRNQLLTFGGHNIQTSPFQTANFNRGNGGPENVHFQDHRSPHQGQRVNFPREFQPRPQPNNFQHRPDVRFSGPMMANHPNPPIDSTIHAHISNSRPINGNNDQDRFKIVSSVGQTQVDGPWTFIGQMPEHIFTDGILEELEISPPVRSEDGKFVEFHIIPHQHFNPNGEVPMRDNRHPAWWNRTTTQSPWLTVSEGHHMTSEPPKQSVSFVESSMTPGSETPVFSPEFSDRPHKVTPPFHEGRDRPRLQIITRKPIITSAGDDAKHHGPVHRPLRPVPINIEDIPHNFRRPVQNVQHPVPGHNSQDHETTRFNHPFRPSDPISEDNNEKHFSSTFKPNVNQHTSNRNQNQFTTNRFVPHNFNNNFDSSTEPSRHESPRPISFEHPETRPKPLDITMKPHTDIVPSKPFFHRPTVPSTGNGNKFTHTDEFSKDDHFHTKPTESSRRPQSFNHFQDDHKSHQLNSDTGSDVNRFPEIEFDNDERLEGFTVQPDPAIIPPRPPFLPDIREPMYFIPTEKNVPASTTSPRDRPTSTNPTVIFHPPQDFTISSAKRPNPTSNDFSQHIGSFFDDFHTSTKNQIDSSEKSTERSSFDEPFHLHDLPFQVVTKSTSQRANHNIPTTKTKFGTDKPNHMPIPKFLTPLVNFRNPNTEHSLVSHGVVTVTPIAIATPEFIPKPPVRTSSTTFLRPSSSADDFGSSEKKAEEEYDTLFTPVTSRPTSTPFSNFPFKKVFSTNNGFSTTFRNEAPQTLDDDDDFTQQRVTESHSTGFDDTEVTNFVSSTSSFNDDNTFTNKFHQGSSLFPPFQVVNDEDQFFNNFKGTSSPASPNRFPTDYRPPQAGSLATECDPDVCHLPQCFCGGNNRIPGDLSANEVPQLVMLTFDDDVNEVNWSTYKKLLYSGRRNPNGCPIQATFYVSHEWTDYSKVQTLYADGHEIASHSISHPDGAKFSKQRWMDEIQGQREILSYLGGVPKRDIQGMRAPFLAVGGNKMFGMLYETNFTYDSSLPVPIHDPPMWPYTLDFALGHDCMIPPCPRNSFPGVWEIPMIMWVDLKGGRCSMADACQWPDTKEKVFETLAKNFQRHYRSNRAPFNLFFHSAWFEKPHYLEGFQMFLDKVLTRPDVYFVTSSQAIEWMRRPTPVREIHGFVPFACHLRSQRTSHCKKPQECQLRFRSETRYLRTCQECPEVYPWVKNPFGKAPNNDSAL